MAPSCYELLSRMSCASKWNTKNKGKAKIPSSASNSVTFTLLLLGHKKKPVLLTGVIVIWTPLKSSGFHEQQRLNIPRATTCNLKLHLLIFDCQKKFKQIPVRVGHHSCLPSQAIVSTIWRTQNTSEFCFLKFTLHQHDNTRRVNLVCDKHSLQWRNSPLLVLL